jgi:hypothetical protein
LKERQGKMSLRVISRTRPALQGEEEGDLKIIDNKVISTSVGDFVFDKVLDGTWGNEDVFNQVPVVDDLLNGMFSKDSERSELSQWQIFLCFFFFLFLSFFLFFFLFLLFFLKAIITLASLELF